MKPKIALVVQRYGLEVNGGSEYSCRLYAEKLFENYEVEILTTKAKDYMTWENYYTEDIEELNGVVVRRFKTNHPRNVAEFNRFSEKLYSNSERTIYDELEWMRLQGPVSYDLLSYIKNFKDEYCAFIFFTYTYFTTFFGLQLVPDKSILIPTAHDEPPIHLSIYQPFFHLARKHFFLTEEEMNFVHKKFNNEYIPSEILGIGIDPISYEASFFENRINSNYIIYVGRIDESKGCKELFDYFIRYKEEHPSNLKLVLVGKPVLKVPTNKDIISLGFIDDKEKAAAIYYSDFLIMPSKYESLSLVVLEAFLFKKAVLVNAHSEVLKGHCEKSNGGLYYQDYEEFKACLQVMEDKNFLNILGKNGEAYVKENYTWEKTMNKMIMSIENISILKKE
ncbi:glycosyltransferase family 4 protein [Paenibacillus sp. D51F]